MVLACPSPISYIKHLLNKSPCSSWYLRAWRLLCRCNRMGSSCSRLFETQPAPTVRQSPVNKTWKVQDCANAGLDMGFHWYKGGSLLHFCFPPLVHKLWCSGVFCGLSHGLGSFSNEMPCLRLCHTMFMPITYNNCSLDGWLDDLTSTSNFFPGDPREAGSLCKPGRWGRTHQQLVGRFETSDFLRQHAAGIGYQTLPNILYILYMFLLAHIGVPVENHSKELLDVIITLPAVVFVVTAVGLFFFHLETLAKRKKWLRF